jgi:hypothetical protein
MEYRHDKYCDIGTVAQEYALRYPGRRHPDSNAYQGLEQRLRKTGYATATAHVNASRPQTLRTPAAEDAVIAAV